MRKRVFNHYYIEFYKWSNTLQLLNLDCLKCHRALLPFSKEIVKQKLNYHTYKHMINLFGNHECNPCKCKGNRDCNICGCNLKGYYNPLKGVNHDNL